MTFVISGLRKLPGVQFTILPPEDPVGGFFSAMYDTGIFWYFIGVFQIVTGLLALFNRFAPLAKQLADSEDRIIDELNDVQGRSVEIGGYYQPDPAKAEAVMRPSKTLNAVIMDA